MLLRRARGMAMGLVGVSGFSYLCGGAPALTGRPDLDAHGTDYTFGVIRCPADGWPSQQFRHQPRTVPRRHVLSGICAAGSALRRSQACGGFAASAARRWRPPRRSRRWPIRKCALRLSASFATGVIAAGGTWAQCCRRRPCSRSTASSPNRISASCSWPASFPALAMTMYMITIALIGVFQAGLPADRPADQLARTLRRPKDIWAPVLLLCSSSAGLTGCPFLPRFTPTEAGGRRRHRCVPDRRADRAARQGEILARCCRQPAPRRGLTVLIGA